MPERAESSPAPVPPPPALPEVDSPAPGDVLDSVPTKEQVVEDAQSADDIVAGQPGVDELLGRDEA